jgi:hypothetical protein
MADSAPSSSRCPLCLNTDTRPLQGLTQTAMNYFRCDVCCHVWTQPKEQTASESAKQATAALKSRTQSGSSSAA